jgi:hypothetical protein
VAAQHLGELIRRLHPDTSVRQLEARAGLPENALGYWLKPSTEVKRIPHAEAVGDIAFALGCDPIDVVRAFAADVGLPYTESELTNEEHEHLRILRQLTPRDRATLRTVGLSMLRTSQDNGADSPFESPP